MPVTCATASYDARRSSASGPSTASAHTASTPTGPPSCSATSTIATSTPRSTHDGYHLDSFAVERVAHQRGTAYVRLVCSVSVRPTRLRPTLAARTLRGVLDELMLAPARAHATCARLIDVAVVGAL